MVGLTDSISLGLESALVSIVCGSARYVLDCERRAAIGADLVKQRKQSVVGTSIVLVTSLLMLLAAILLQDYYLFMHPFAVSPGAVLIIAGILG